MIDEAPLVSIITPSLNQGGFLEPTILSVLNQTYPNIEYIIMDGGSTDQSLTIIQQYQSKITYWESQPDKGQSDAINKGITKAKGTIIAYLNADDLLDSEAVSLAVEEFKNDPQLALVYGQCATIDENDNVIVDYQGKQVDYLTILKTGMLPNIYQPACFFQKHNIGRSELFNSNLHYTMDYELILSILKKGGKHQFIAKPFAQYRVHDNAKTTSQADQLYIEKLKVQFRMAPHLFMLWGFRYCKHQLKMRLG